MGTSIRVVMGGGYYDREVETVSAPASRSNASAAAFSAAAASRLTGNFYTHIKPDADPKHHLNLVCEARDPVIVAVDMTGSMGDWPKVVWDKLPMFFGQIMLQGYLQDPQLAFCGIGDTITHQARTARQPHAFKPVQVTRFATGSAIDDELEKITQTSGNGPKKHYEPYGLAMFYYARFVEFPNCVGKPVLFITADEFFYDVVPSEHLRQTFGIDHPDVTVVDIMRELRNKYEVFVVKKKYTAHEGYEESISAQWETVISRERILRLEDPKAVVDVMLGAISICKGTRSLESYGADMVSRGQDSHRMDIVGGALSGFAASVQSGQDPCNEAAALAAELAAAHAELAALQGAAPEDDDGLVRSLSNDLLEVKAGMNRKKQAPAKKANKTK